MAHTSAAHLCDRVGGAVVVPDGCAGAQTERRVWRTV